MIRPPLPVKSALRLAVVGGCAMALSGCISLLPKTKPALLYRFGAPAAAGAPASVPKTVGVFRATGVFAGEAAGDQILTMSGGKAAYIAGSRWVSPAPVLFDEAVLGAFDAGPGPARLISRGEPGQSDYSLRIDVRTFEARYENGPDAAPVVVVRLRAALSKADRSNVGEQIFEARVPASDNRVGAIVDAYNKALGETLTKLVAWTDKGVAS